MRAGQAGTVESPFELRRLADEAGGWQRRGSWTESVKKRRDMSQEHPREGGEGGREIFAFPNASVLCKLQRPRGTRAELRR